MIQIKMTHEDIILMSSLVLYFHEFPEISRLIEINFRRFSPKISKNLDRFGCVQKLSTVSCEVSIYRITNFQFHSVEKIYS